MPDQTPPPETHELLDFMNQASDQMAAEYQRIRRNSSEDPGTAGDEGEENWATLLRQWLPRGYHVKTKGRLLSTDGRRSPQLDVIVLRPSYPPKLVDENKKLYLAEGVAAAFECKLTLRSGDVNRAVRTAARLRDLLRAREGTPYRELTSPLFFGALAHAHGWNRPGSDPGENITQEFIQSDLEFVTHPRQAMNLLCVADLGTWSLMKTTGLGPAQLGANWLATQRLYGYPPEGGVSTVFVGPRVVPGESGRATTPIGVMFASLIQALAWEDADLQPIADYFRLAGLFGSGAGQPRIWEWNVYTAGVRQKAEGGALTQQPWDEWSLTIL